MFLTLPAAKTLYDKISCNSAFQRYLEVYKKFHEQKFCPEKSRKHFLLLLVYYVVYQTKSPSRSRSTAQMAEHLGRTPQPTQLAWAGLGQRGFSSDQDRVRVQTGGLVWSLGHQVALGVSCISLLQEKVRTCGYRKLVWSLR